jgi:hypothetical protein
MKKIARSAWRRLRHSYRDWRLQRIRKTAIQKMERLGGFHNGTSVIPLKNGDAGNAVIGAALRRGSPCMLARFGLHELQITAGIRYRNPQWIKDGMMSFYESAGFFPRDPSLFPRFADVYVDAAREMDLFGAWNYRHGLWEAEERVFREWCPNAELADIRAFDAFCYGDPWSAALEGRNVLVVHPFARTIESQYAKREKLFANPKILPRFASLQTLAAVQSIAGNPVPFVNWFDALDHMREQVGKLQFDVAIIGAGAYGLPLAAHVKRMGRQAVHMGGVTQMLFGIRGNRWENWYPDLFNEHWVRPAESEKPAGAQRVEKACYW